MARYDLEDLNLNLEKQNGSSTPTEDDLLLTKLLQDDAVPEQAKELMRHMLDCLGGSIPPCATCLGTGSIQYNYCAWGRCPDCQD